MPTKYKIKTKLLCKIPTLSVTSIELHKLSLIISCQVRALTSLIRPERSSHDLSC